MGNVMKRVMQPLPRPVPGRTMALQAQTTPAPALHGVCCQCPAQEPAGPESRALCSQEDRAFRGDVLKQLAQDSDDVPPPHCEGWPLPWALFQAHVHPSPCQCCDGEEQRAPMAPPSPSPHPAPLHQELQKPEKLPALVPGCRLLLEPFGHWGQAASRL